MKNKINSILYSFLMLILIVSSGCSSKVVKKEKEKEPLVPFMTTLTTTSFFEKSVGYVLVYDVSGRVLNGYCSGFVVGKDKNNTYLVTNYERMKGNHTYKFVLDGQMVECIYINGDETLNISVLSFKSNKLDSEVLKFNTNIEQMLVGNSIYTYALKTYSSSAINNMGVSKGIISKTDAIYCDSDYLYDCASYFIVDNVTFDAEEGAPVFDYYGRVIGVVSNVNYISDGNNPITYVTKSDDVSNVVNSILSGKDYPRADLHVEVKMYEKLTNSESVNITEMNYYDVVIVDTTGYTESLNVELYSKIISIDNHIINNVVDLVEVMDKYRSNDVVILKIQIGDEEFKTYSIRV